MTQAKWQLDAMQIISVILIATIGMWWRFGLTGQSAGSPAVAGAIVATTVQAELGATQPTKIIQDNNQWVARFKLSTENIDAITITGVTLSFDGTLASQIVRYYWLYPLTVSQVGDPTIVGKGESWEMKDGFLQQTVVFNSPTKVKYGVPVEMDVHMDLIGQYQNTTGLWLIGVSGPAVTKGLPLDLGKLEIKDRL